MPISTDNQDYSNEEKQSKDQNSSTGEKNVDDSRQTGSQDENNFTSDNLKGKKVDADLGDEKDKPAKV